MANLAKIYVLMGASRYDLAERELRKVLAEDVDDAEVHCMLAYALNSQEKYGPALAEAQEAVRLNPDDDENHYCLALAQLCNDQPKLAEASVRRALELDPDWAPHWGLLASIHVRHQRWKAALEAADAGLALDPRRQDCLDARARALAALGRYEDADRITEEALSRDPEDETAHCNRGWTLLRRGAAAEAAVHFREALRIDPRYEHAREGLIESLRARHRLYGLFLRAALWTERLPGWVSWALVIGFVVGSRTLSAFSGGRPYVRAAALMLLVAWLLMWVWYWAARPLATLTLRASRENRRVLSPDQIAASNWHAMVLFMIVMLLAAWPWVGLMGALLGAVMGAILLPAITAVYAVPAGRVRWWLAGYVGVFALIAAVGVAGRSLWGILALALIIGPLPALLLVVHAPKLLLVSLFGIMMTEWVGQSLLQRQRRQEQRGYGLELD